MLLREIYGQQKNVFADSVLLVFDPASRGNISPPKKSSNIGS